MAIGYATVFLITNHYGAAAFGELALSLTVLNIATVVSKFGIDAAIVRIIGELKAKGKSSWLTVKKALYFTGFLAIAVSVLLCYSASYIAEELLQKPLMTFNLQVISIALIPATLTAIISGTLRGQKRTTECAAVPVLSQIAMLLALAVGFAISTSVVVLQAASKATAGIFLLAWFYRDQEKASGSSRKLIEILTMSFPMMLASSFLLMTNWIDVLMIGSIMTEADVGKYAIAVRLSTLASLGLVSVNVIAGPKFVELYNRGDKQHFKLLVKQTNRLTLLISLPVLAILLAFPTFILAYFGTEFIEAKHALCWLIFGQFVNASCGSVGVLLQMTGGERVVLGCIIVSTIVNVALNLVLIPLFEIEGAAIASMVSMTVWNLAMLIAVRYRLSFWALPV